MASPVRLSQACRRGAIGERIRHRSLFTAAWRSSFFSDPSSSTYFSSARPEESQANEHDPAEESAPLETVDQEWARLAELGDLPSATKRLQELVSHARATNQTDQLSSEVFERHLELAIAHKPQAQPAYLSSPIDDLDEPSGSDSHLIDALRVTLAADVAPAKDVLIGALKLLSTATLWDLLPFQEEASNSSEMRFTPRWHPWENEADGLAVPTETIQAFGDLVALALTKRGELAPALHILQTKFPVDPFDDGDSPIKPSSSQPDGDVPDIDLFMAVISFLTSRASTYVRRKDAASRENHLAVNMDVKLLMHIYQAAVESGQEIETSMNDNMVQALSALLKSSVSDLGDYQSSRRQRMQDHSRSQAARINMDHGAARSLTLFLQRLSTALLTIDPSLKRGSLSLEAHASLIGLHLKVRDYAYSKRLYKLFRARDPTRTLWAEEEDSDSLFRTAQDRISAPDRASFGWFFVHSIRTSRRPHFAVRLYLDWLASGNRLTSDLAAIFISALLKAGLNAVAERLMRDMHEQRVAIPPQLAKAFVSTFADAGYPEHAIAMATALTKAFNERLLPGDTRAHVPDAVDALRPSLEIYCVALDRASKGHAEWTTERKQGLFRLFDEFRLVLGHYMRQAEDGRHQRRGTTNDNIRMAYNAALRTHLEHHSDLQESMQDPLSGRRVSLPAINQITQQQIARLVEEMKDLGVEPDSTTWGFMLLSDLLYDESRGKAMAKQAEAFQGKNTKGKQRLLRAMRTYTAGNTATFTVSERVGRGGECITREKEVYFKSYTVGKLMYSLARGGEFEMAERVYNIWKLRDVALHQNSGAAGVKSWDKGIEGARVYLLAAQGKPEWRTELEKLIESGYKLSRDWQHQLETVSKLSGTMAK